MSIHHLTIAVRGRRALARDEGERRVLLRRLVRVGHKRLLLFSLVDDHLHAVLRAVRAGVLADGLRRVLKAHRPDLELKRPHLEPVGTRSYLRWPVDYLLTQPQHHGLENAPALWTGSCFQDLVGARLLPGFDAGGLRAELPRLRLRELFGKVGLSPTPLEPADDAVLARVGVARLVELAAGVHAAGPVLTGRAREVVEVRALAARVAAMVGLSCRTLARFLGVSSRSVHYAAKREIDPRAVLALQRRLTLEERVAGVKLPGPTSISG